MIAAYNGDIQKMQQLVAQGAPIEAKNKYGMTALFFGAGASRTQPTPKGSTEAVKFLVDHGAAVNVNRNDGRTPLIVVADNQNAGSVSLLIQHGADVNAVSANGESALTMAASQLDLNVVKLLLDHGARVNGYADSNGQTPLLAAIAATPRLTPASFKEADEITTKDKVALGSAIIIVRLLLDHGAEMNAADRNGQTALTLSIEQRNLLVVRALLDAGADPNVIDKAFGNSSALVLAVKDRQVAIAEMLLKKGAKVDTRDQLGKSALDYANEYGPKKMVEILRQAGANS